MKAPRQPRNLLRHPPLYQQAVAALRSRLPTMAPGTYLPSERVLAEEYGVSLITIREAVRILAAEGVLERQQGKGTMVAATRKNGWVAITIDQDVTDPRTSSVYLRIAQEVRALLEKEGRASRLYIGRNIPAEAQTDFLCPEFFKDLEDGQITSIIGVLLYGQAPWISTLPEKGVHLVGLGTDKTYAIDDDTPAFYRSAVEDLVRRGKRRISLLCWGGFEKVRTEDREIFRRVLSEAGLPVVDSWIKDDIYPTLEGAGWAAFREIWSARSQRPDGLVISDDYFLGGVSSALEEIHLDVPQDLEIAVRISRLPMAHSSFPMITWETDASLAAEMLVEMERKLREGKPIVPPTRAIPLKRTPENDCRVKSLALHRAFTTLELLVVIAILAILALVAYPVSKNIRESSTAAVCINQQKAIGLAIFSYAKENRNYLPPAMANNSAAWRALIAPYLSSSKVSICPSRPAIAPTDSNYAYNMAFGNVGADGLRKITYNGAAPGLYELHNLLRFRERSRTSMLMDIAHVAGAPNFAPPKGGHVFYYDGHIPAASFSHNNALNVLWVDGHISRVSRNEIKKWTAMQWNGTGNYR